MGIWSHFLVGRAGEVAGLTEEVGVYPWLENAAVVLKELYNLGTSSLSPQTIAPVYLGHCFHYGTQILFLLLQLVMMMTSKTRTLTGHGVDLQNLHWQGWPALAAADFALDDCT